MKNFRRVLMLLFIFTLIIVSNSTGVSASWRQDSLGWWNTEGNSYSTGWKQIDGKWFYFNSQGYMKTGWINDGGKYYYLFPNGSMAYNTTISGYTVDSNGVWVQTKPAIANVAKTTSINTTVATSSSNNSISKVNDTEIKENTYRDYSNKNKTINEDDEDIDDADDYIVKNKNTTNTSSSNISSTSSTTDDYYDYTSKGSNETWVSGFYRNGKYVSGHYRTKKDSTTSNNYSHKGNTNPHNGKKGYSKK